jgi:hypothetical protein
MANGVNSNGVSMKIMAASESNAIKWRNQPWRRIMKAAWRIYGGSQ